MFFFLSYLFSFILSLCFSWNNGENHLILNFLTGKHASVINLNTGNAIIAGAGFDSWTFRPNFDISLPVFVPMKNLSSENYERYAYSYNTSVN